MNEPMTDAELSDIERRADITDSIEYVCDESTMSDLRRLLAELRRTRAELAAITESSTTPRATPTGGIVVNVEHPREGSTMDNYAIGYSAGLRNGRRGR